MKAPLTVTLALLLPAAALAAPPSPRDLERWAAHEKQRDARLERAAPWKAALDTAMPAEADSTREILFLITYKHHVQDSGKPAPAGLAKRARAFAMTWAAIRKDCGKAKVDPHEVAQATYRLTNSDWAPVSAATGPGLDRVATPKDLKTWSDALVRVAKRARKAGMDPAQVWSDQAKSYDISKPADLEKAKLKPAPRRF